MGLTRVLPLRASSRNQSFSRRPCGIVAWGPGFFEPSRRPKFGTMLFARPPAAGLKQPSSSRGEAGGLMFQLACGAGCVVLAEYDDLMGLETNWSELLFGETDPASLNYMSQLIVLLNIHHAAEFTRRIHGKFCRSFGTCRLVVAQLGAPTTGKPVGRVKSHSNLKPRGRYKHTQTTSRHCLSRKGFPIFYYV